MFKLNWFKLSFVVFATLSLVAFFRFFALNDLNEDSLVEADEALVGREKTAILRSEGMEALSEEENENMVSAFRAAPSQKLIRGDKETLVYPEVVISKRSYQKGKVYEVSPLHTVTEGGLGELSASEVTAEVYEAKFDVNVIEGFLNSDAEFLSLPISADEDVLVSVAKTYERGEHTVTLFGHTAGKTNNETFVVVHDGVMYGTVHEVAPYRVFEYAVNGSGDIAIRHLDTTKDLYGTCELTKEVVSNQVSEPSIQNLNNPILKSAQSALSDSHLSSDSAPAGQVNFDSNGVNPSASRQVDLVVTYLEAAATALGGVSAAEAKIIGHVDSTTQMFLNSQIDDVVFNVLATGLETVATGGIVRPTEPADHNSLQEALGADISGKMYVGGGGSAWTPNDFYVYEGFQFGNSVGVSTASSFPHEIGHNFGANHSFGDGGYNNNITTARHYGWRFRVEGYNYRTVMSYTSNQMVGENAANGYGPRIGYLSNPNQSYLASTTSGRQLPVALGVADGFNGSSYAYMDATLLRGGRNATFLYSDNGSPGFFSSELFTYVAGGSVANAYDGTHALLGANNQSVVASRVGIHAAHGVRVSYDFTSEFLSSYEAGEVISYSAFVGDHHDSVSVDLYKDGVFVQSVATGSEANITGASWEVPASGLVSGGGYQLYLNNGSQVVRSAVFSLSLPIVAAVSDDPIAYYAFDEGQGVVLNDSSGNGHYAIIEGAKWSSGLSGNAVEIDPEDVSANAGVVIPASAFSAVTNQISISFWTYGDNSLPRYNSMLNGRGFNNHLPWIDGKLYFDAGGDRVFTDSLNEEDYKNKWNHYVYSKNTSTGEMKVFINGAQKAYGVNKWGALAGAGNLRIGSANYGGVFAYKGLIDNVAIYNKALTNEEISTIHVSEKPQSSLLAHYRFDAGAELEDATGNGNTAFLNGALWNQGGLSGGALEIDGDNPAASRGVTIPASAFSGVTNEVSISLWTYGDASLPRYTVLFNGRGYNNHLPWINGGVYWDAGGDRIATVLAEEEYKGAWNHYVFTKNVIDGTMEMFVNGELRSSGEAKLGVLPQGGDFFLGSASGVGVLPYDGLIDEVKIYNEAVSAAKVIELYNEGFDNTSLQAHYAFDQGAELVDSSGNGHDAVLNGARWNASGLRGSALEVDADDASANKGITIPSAAFQEVTDELTISFWTAGDASLPRENVFLSGRGLSSHLPWSNGWAYWDASGDRAAVRLESVDYQSRWNHYVFTKNVSTGVMKVFINGVERASEALRSSALSTNGDVYVGSAIATGLYAYDGLIDEIRIYNTELTAEEVNALYFNSAN